MAISRPASAWTRTVCGSRPADAAKSKQNVFLFVVAFSGLKNGSVFPTIIQNTDFWTIRLPFSGSKADTALCKISGVRTAWAWIRAVLGELGPAALLINLDETGVPVWIGGASAIMLRRRATDPHRGHEMTSRTTRRAMRAQVAHVAVICNDVEAQRRSCRRSNW